MSQYTAIYNEKNNFSAAELIKCSAKQIVFKHYNKHKSKEVSNWAKRGSRLQQIVSVNKKFVEMAGCYTFKTGGEAPVPTSPVPFGRAGGGNINYVVALSNNPNAAIHHIGTTLSSQEHQYRIYFSIDEVRMSVENKQPCLRFIEHKSVFTDTVEEWYLQFSLLQVAFYQALLDASKATSIDTAKFYVEAGGTKMTLPISSKVFNRKWLLVFSYAEELDEKGAAVDSTAMPEDFTPSATKVLKQDTYEVRLINGDAIIDYYKRKIVHVSSGDYSLAGEYDAIYKKKDWDNLSQYFTYRQINLK